jgi:hypothetical protein
MTVRRPKNKTDWEPVRIQHPGILSITELRQGLYEDLAKLNEMHGVEYVKNGWLYLPISDMEGEPLNLLNRTGRPVRRIPGTTYHSAASDYTL